LVGFNFFTAAAKVPSIRALVARLMRRQRVRAQAKIKRKFTQALLLAGDGRRAPYLVLHPSAQRLAHVIAPQQSHDARSRRPAHDAQQLDRGDDQQPMFASR
jgi:hypothetical protein